MSKKGLYTVAAVILIILLCQTVIYANNQESYILGAEDVLDIRVWNHPNFNTNVIIRPDGYLTLPVVGEVYAAGTSPMQLASLIEVRLAEYINGPVVSVAVMEFKKIKISVIGAVGRPSVYRVDPDTKLLEVLALAGVQEESGLIEEVTLTRNETVLKIDVKQMLQEGGQKNYLLKDKDVIYVPLVDREVFVLGEVMNPGAFAIDTKTTPADILSMAGGPTERANLKKVKIIRRGAIDFPKIIDLENFLEGDQFSDLVYLQDGDILQVEESKSINWEKIFAYAAGIKIIRDLIVQW